MIRHLWRFINQSMIVEVIAVSNYILMVYYCSDRFYRLCMIGDRGLVLDFNDIFYCEKLAIDKGRAIIRTIA